MTRRCAARADEGSVLVMALAFLGLFALAVAAVLTFADAGFRTAASVHSTVEKQYAADAAVEGAINAIRGDITVGKDGVTSSCLPATSAVNAVSVSVSCLGRAGSGASTGGAGGGLVPANSVLTLPTSSGEGVVLSAGAAPLVSGDVLTNQTRAVPAGSSLTVQGRLTCRATTGTGTVTATTTSCPASTAPAATDPAYDPEIVSRPAAATLPACPAGAVATFVPGYYSSAAALNALTTGACANKRFHFTPGAYYFEFTDGLPGGTRQWLINDATAEVVGGTLTTTAFPNRCDLGSAGVQFIFGSDSRLAVTAGSLELCPPLSTGQRIAVYGAKTTAPVVGPLTTLTPTTATSTRIGPETATYTPASAGLTIGDGVEARFGATGNKYEGSISLTGFSSIALPAHAEITSATVRVASRYENQSFNLNPRLDVIAGDGTTVDYDPQACLFATCARGTVVSINVLSQISTPAKANGVSMRYRTKDKAGNPFLVSYLDGVALDIGYRIPGLVATSGCAAYTGAAYSPTSVTTTCPVFRGTGGASAKMAIKGTVYAPLGAVDLSMTGQLNAVTQRGIVARTLQLGLTAGSGYTGALVGMPGSADRSVLITASVGGSAALRADVTFADGLGATPGAAVTVDRWTVLR